VPSIDCSGCARSIQAALGAVEGISDFDVDVAARRIRVDYDNRRLDEADIRDALEGPGSRWERRSVEWRPLKDHSRRQAAARAVPAGAWEVPRATADRSRRERLRRA
jgi:copper chaperone CopZ